MKIENKAQKIEFIDPELIVPWEKNVNQHSDEQIYRLCKLIEHNGFRDPLIISNRSGFLICGHGRLICAKKLKLQSVPVIYQDFRDEAEEYQFMVAHNAIAKDSWASLNLSKINTDIIDLGPDFDIEMLAIKDFVIEPIEKFEPQSDEDEVPEVVHPITRRGDLWILGNHRLYCGDSTMIDDVEKLMNGEKADLTFTSPPYNAGKSESLSGNTHSGDNKYNKFNDNQSQSDWLNLMIQFTNNAISFSSLLINNIQQLSGNKIAFIEYLSTFKNNIVDISIWDKGHGAPQMQKGVLANRFENIVFISNKESPSRIIEFSSWHGKYQNVYNAPKQTNNEYSNIHAATFPIHLPEYFISQICDKSKSVIDFFCGTGTTLIACEKTNRKCYGMELDEKYCDVIINRWQNYTGKKAVLELSKQTYEELKLERLNG